MIVALAACHPAGATAREAEAWAERFCRQHQRVASPTRGDRWTTAAARRIDDDLATALRRDRSGAGAAAQKSSSVVRGPAPQVAALTSDDRPIHFLGAPPGRTSLLAQAEVIDACRQVWEEAGLTVAVSTPTAEGAARWAVLAGLTPHRPGERADVLIVDQADRRTTADLTRLVAGPAGRLIFVEGGTLPRLTNPASHGLMEVADEVGRHFSPAHVDWSAAGMAAAGGYSSPASVGRTAAQSLLQAWTEAQGRPVMVGLGLEETRALNRAALGARGGRTISEARLLSGNAADRAGRSAGDLERLLPGDRVVVLKGRAGLPSYGTFGTVVEADGGARALTSVGRDRGTGAPGRALRVAWDNGEHSEIESRSALAGLGFGYAVTPHLAARTKGPLMVLGPASAVGRARERVVLDVGLPSAGRSRERTVGW